MGKVEGVARWVYVRMLRQLSRMLDPDEREAVLGDLAEEGTGPLAAMFSVAGLAFRRVLLRRRTSRVVLQPAGAVLASNAEDAKPWPEWAVPLLFGLLAAGCAVAVMVPSQTRTLSWPGLISLSAWLLLGAALSAVTAIFLVHRGFRDYLGRPGSTLIACAWSTAIWIPLLLLLWSQHALWVVLTPIPIAAILASFSKRRRDAYLENSDPSPHVLLEVPRELFEDTLRLHSHKLAVVPVACALLLDAACFAAAAGQLSLTSSFVILITALLAWAFTPDTVTVSGGMPPRSRVAVLPCFLLTCLALTPFLRVGMGGAGLSSVVLARPVMPVPHVIPVPSHVYSGVVLMAPPLPKRKILASPPKALLGGVVRPTRPLTIPFDGAYWYFQDPETAPKPDAQVQRGDPLKDHVHSSEDWTPIKMEAHQRLGARLEASCCQALSVALVNADNRRGLIEVEAKLRNVTRSGTTAISLGTVPIRSSGDPHIALNRPRVNETLRFALRGKAQQFKFNEIALVFKLARERNLAGARVQVVNFTLQP